MTFFGAGILILCLGKVSGTGAGADPPAPSPWSDMSSESLLQLELPGTLAGTAIGALLVNHLYGDSGSLLGVTVPAFASSVANSVRSH